MESTEVIFETERWKFEFLYFDGRPREREIDSVNLLFSMGYPVVPEVGRKIIQEQVSIKGNALPWGDDMSLCRTDVVAVGT